MQSTRWLEQPVFGNVLMFVATNELNDSRISGNIGSCVMLNSQIGLTAAHVLDNAKKHQGVLKITPDKTSARYTYFRMNQVYIHSKYFPIYPNSALKPISRPEYDIAVFTLERPFPDIIPIEDSLSDNTKPIKKSNNATVVVGYPGSIYRTAFPVLSVRDNSNYNPHMLATDSVLPVETHPAHRLDPKILVRHGVSGGGLFHGEQLIGVASRNVLNHNAPTGRAYFTSLDFNRDWLRTTLAQAKADLKQNGLEAKSSRQLTYHDDTVEYKEENARTRLVETQADVKIETATLNNQAILRVTELVKIILIGDPTSRLYWMSQYQREEDYDIGLPRGISIMQDYAGFFKDDTLLSEWAKIIKMETEQRNRFFCCMNAKPLSIHTLAFYHCFAGLDVSKPKSIDETHQKLIAWVAQHGNEHMKNACNLEAPAKPGAAVTSLAPAQPEMKR